MKKILILGGGFAGIETFRRLHKKLHPANEHGVQLELVNRDNYFTFSPMLHEAATGSVAREHVVQPLREVLVCCGKDFHQASVTGIDLEKRVVTTDQASHSYDYLVIALGVEQGFFGVPGAEEYALALKWLDGALKIRNRVINSFERASEMHDVHNLKAVDKFLRFIIVGGGATGTELAGQLSDLTENEMREFYGDVPHSMSEIVLVHAGSRLLEHLSEKSSALAKQRLERLGVKVLLNETATEVRGDAVVLKSGHTIPSNSVFWTAGTESLLPNFLPDEVLNERGLAKVDPTFELMGHEGVFVLGDAARLSISANGPGDSRSGTRYGRQYCGSAQRQGFATTQICA
mgnify:CR=1 FL=1